MARTLARPSESGSLAKRSAGFDGPERVGPFRLIDRVASSGFTVTYRAEQGALGRTVLVKTLKPHVAVSSSFAAEIEREALILARLDHDGVPVLHDFVRAEEETYLVLEDPRGAPVDALLQRWAARGRRDLELACALLLAAARILAQIHDRGVVHRSLSATALGVAAPGRVLVSDFGAATATGVLLPELPEVVAGADRGDAARFLAPEQILGEEAGPPADLWALAVVAHLLFTGAHPFAGSDAHATAARIRASEPLPLPHEVPGPFARALGRCLMKDPRDRFANGAELVAALEAAAPALASASLVPPLSRAAALLGLREALDRVPGAPAVEPGAKAFSLARPAASLALVCVVGVVGQLVIRAWDDPDATATDGVSEAPPPGARGDVGLVRVVARPWAKVFIDGDAVDTTPIGKPIPVPPGRHFVTFRHPMAPDEQRTIKISAGQSVLLDVTMRIDHGDAGKPDASAPTSP